jgi:hypothetical protein
VLADWAVGAGAKVIAIDPMPQPELVRRGEERAELDLIEATSADALRDMDLPDAVIIDGDHNYHTVTEELGWIGERAQGADFPLLMLHDVGWPHARRDAYYAPDRIPEEYQEAIEEGVGVFPGEPGVTLGGLPYKWAAREEGGPRNGVLTALEDFLADRGSLRLAIVPIFFGLGVVWHEDAPWAGAVAEVLAPWDRNPIMARLEGNRTLHLASQHVARTYQHMAEDEVERQRRFLLMLADSDAFKLASRLAALRHRGEPTLSEQLEEVLRPADSA